MPENSVLSKEGLEYYDGKSKERLSTELDKKVDKVSGKGLSTNDYTTDEKNKLSGIATGANKTTVDSALSSSSTNPVQNKVINTALSEIDTKLKEKSDINHTHTTVNGHTVNADVPANAKFTDTNTTYDDVTQSTHGLMTPDDKKKLDGIAVGATAGGGKVVYQSTEPSGQATNDSWLQEY